MATTDGAAALLAYVGASDADMAFATAKHAEALALVTAYVGSATVPPAVLDQAVLEVGSKLWARKSAPQGAAQYDTLGSAPAMTPRDPLVTVYPTLARFIGAPFA